MSVNVIKKGANSLSRILCFIGFHKPRFIENSNRQFCLRCNLIDTWLEW